MGWLYGQAWLWYLLAFAVGVLLAWVTLVRPAQRRLRAAPAAARPARVPAAAVPAAPEAARPVEPLTRRPPAVDPAMSTLDHRAGSAGIAVAGVRDVEPVTTRFPVVTLAGGEDTTQIPVIAPEVVPGAFPGSALPRADGAAPTPEHTIKGNARSMLYHGPTSPYYGRTTAEVWFTSAEDAEAAGFTDVRRRRG